MLARALDYEVGRLSAAWVPLGEILGRMPA
jgi:hypothetical protein